MIPRIIFFLSVGVYELTHNNKTISLKTINAVQQMTLYPELIASVLYQASGSEVCAFLLLSVLSLWLCLCVCVCDLQTDLLLDNRV